MKNYKKLSKKINIIWLKLLFIKEQQNLVIIHYIVKIFIYKNGFILMIVQFN